MQTHTFFSTFSESTQTSAGVANASSSSSRAQLRFKTYPMTLIISGLRLFTYSCSKRPSTIHPNSPLEVGVALCRFGPAATPLPRIARHLLVRSLHPEEPKFYLCSNGDDGCVYSLKGVRTSLFRPTIPVHQRSQPVSPPRPPRQDQMVHQASVTLPTSLGFGRDSKSDSLKSFSTLRHLAISYSDIFPILLPPTWT